MPPSFQIGSRVSLMFALCMLLPFMLCLFAYRAAADMSAQWQSLQRDAQLRRATLARVGAALDEGFGYFRHALSDGGACARVCADAADALARAADAYQDGGAPSDADAARLAALRRSSAALRAGIHDAVPAATGAALADAARAATAALAQLRADSERASTRADAKMAEASARMPQLLAGALLALALAFGAALLALRHLAARIRQALRMAAISAAAMRCREKDDIARLRRALDQASDCLARRGGAPGHEGADADRRQP